jgi:hypothetical protein
VRRDLIVAALCIVALLVASVLTAKRPEPSKYPTRDSSDYAFGGYRAFYDLVAREGQRVERFHEHHDALDGSVDTLVMAFPDPMLGPQWNDSENDAVRAWIRAGGRLIDIGITPPTAHEDLKAETVLGVAGLPDHGRLHGPWSAQVATVGPRGGERLRVNPGHHAQILLADRSGALVMRYRLGKGDVIAIAPDALFENRNLGIGDDARLAYLAAQPRHAGGVVAFDEAIRGDVSEKPWYTAIDVPERIGLAILTLAGLLWLLYGFFRLGPPVRLRPLREPTSREFLAAVAALYARARARGHARDALLADARRNLERAPRTPENVALLARANASATRPITTDAELVRLAALARTTREEIIRVRGNAAIHRRRTFAGGPGAGHRR